MTVVDLIATTLDLVPALVRTIIARHVAARVVREPWTMAAAGRRHGPRRAGARVVSHRRTGCGVVR